MNRFTRTFSMLTVLVAVAATFVPLALSAQTGVSDDRVNLPEGPGSLDGIGDNSEVDPNMGLMRYSVPIVVPEGFRGTTPSLSLAYSSSGGSSVVGIGWVMDAPYIERTTIFGLPEYDLDDLFAVGGSSQLVRVATGATPVYRERFERNFVRYQWHEPDGGGAGYWTAETPDGIVQYYGADSNGNEVANARLTGLNGVYRYLLVDTVDPYGHQMRYDYEALGTTLLPTRIRYAYVDGTPRYEVRFAYENRPDVLSDCRPGFNEVMSHRLDSVSVYSGAVRLRTYDLEYEDPDDSGGFSRVRRVVQIGRAGNEYPIDYTFGYSQSLGAACTGAACERPYIVTMPSLGVNISAGTGTLVDLNGDALPDFVDTGGSGAHRIFFNRLIPQEDGSFLHTFDPPVDSVNGLSGGFNLASPYTQVLDTNGDGFADLVNTQRSEVLPNLANGDWGVPFALTGATPEDVPDFADDFTPGEDELAHIRFFDYDNDRRIDLIRSEGNTITEIYENIGDGRFRPAPGVGVIGAGFQEGVQMADMNGDGLMDPVRIFDGQIDWKLNLGRGRWTTNWVDSVVGPTLDESQLDAIELEDINGDALDDLVLVQGNEVRYWLNRSGMSFEAERVINSSTVAGIPERTESTTVLFADMNGNGSADVVWVDASGAVTYLELFPVRPNLMTRIETGLGLVTEIDYGTSVEHMSRDGGWEAWPNRLPHAMNVVDSIDTYDRLNEVRDLTEYRYHDGFYDGVEKQFRGYARVETEGAEGDDQEGSLTIQEYFVGDEDPYYNGLPRLTESFALDLEGELIPISRNEMEYDDCDVDGVPVSGLTFPVRHICKVEEIEIRQERLPASEWVTLRTTSEYDGYGNTIGEVSHGVVSIGDGGCGECTRPTDEFGAPCGATCLGDETYTTSEYVSPDNTDGRWILRAVTSERTSARPDGNEYSERRTYYDGDPFVGLALGQLEIGSVRRVEERLNVDDTFVATERFDHDEHGNVIESWGPRATATNRLDRRTYQWQDGLVVTRADILLNDSTGRPITLRQDVEFDPIWSRPLLSTGWYIAEDEDGRTDGVLTFVWDEFERLVSRSLPGDDGITEQYEFDLRSPASRIITRRASVADGERDIVSIQCFDGFGRNFQTRDRIDGDSFYVSGYSVFNRRGVEIRSYQPYTGTGEQCETEPPAGVEFTASRYDAADRLVYMRIPDNDEAGGFSEIRTEFGPLSETTWDEEDLDPSSPHFDTPTTRFQDGQERIVSAVRRFADGSSLRHQYTYNAYGNPTAAYDPEGVVLRQTATPIGHVVAVDDPHRGRRTFEHDESGNIIAETDARGVTLRYAFDGADRMIAQWDDADRAGTLQQWFYDRAPGCSLSVCSNTAGLAAGTSFVVDGTTVQEVLGYSPRSEPVFLARDIDGYRYSFSTEYDNAGRSIRDTMPGGVELAYERDLFGRVTSIEGLIDSLSYDERGNPTDVEASNGVVTMYTHDARMRMDSLTAVGPTGEAVLAYDIERDRVGNVLNVIDNRDLEGRPSSNAQYSYNALYRLVSADLDNGRDGFAEELSYGWSDGGNLVARTSSLGEASSQHVTNILYGGGGAGPYAVTTFGDLTLEYDPAGNTTRRGDSSLSWDGFNRLVSATRGESELLGEYAYDSNDVRAWKREGGQETWYFSEKYEVRNGVATAFVDIDGLRFARIEVGALAAEILSDLAPLNGSATEATPEPDALITAGDAWVAQGASTGAITLTSGVADDPRQLLASSAHRLLLDENLEARSWYHHNHIGSIVAASNDDGEVWQRTEYYPEGQIRWASAEGVENYGYVGKEHDATGLVYFGARYLDPVIGRWINPDPTFATVDDGFIDRREEATNPYAYGLANPINNRDPDGKFIDNIVGAVVGGLGGALVAGITEAVNQWRQVKSGSRPKMNWRRVAWKAAVSGAAGALIGGSGVTGVAAIGVSLGIRAVTSSVTTGLRWKAESAATVARNPNAPPAERAAAMQTYSSLQKAATAIDLTSAVLGAVAGGAGAAAGFGATVPMTTVASSLGAASGALQTGGIAVTLGGAVAGATTNSAQKPSITRPRRNAMSGGARPRVLSRAGSARTVRAAVANQARAAGVRR